MRIFSVLIILLGLSAASAAQTAARPRAQWIPMQATGFPNYCGDSLECLVCEAKVVVRGDIAAIRGDEVDAKVRESIRGSVIPGSTITFNSNGWPFALGQDVVLPLVGERFGKEATQYRFLTHPIVFGQRPYYTMDLKALNTPTEIMAAVRKLAAHPLDPQLKRVSLYSGGRILNVPADPQLEGFAQQWAADRTLYKRLLALQALEPFKSDHNIAIAKALLNDTRSEEVRRPGKWQEGRYSVRESAAKLLAHWGAPRSTLPIDGPILTYRAVEAPGAAYLAGAAVLLFLMIAGSYRLGSTVPFRIALCVLALGLITVLTILWFRSRSRVDEIMFALGNAHHEIASYNGGIHYQVLHDWNHPRQLVYGNFDRQLHDDVWSIDAQNISRRRSVIGFAYASGTGAGPGDSIHSFGLLHVPYWAPISLAIVPLALNFLAIARQSRRRRLGLCRNCGYDLRESPSGICPECGKTSPTAIRRSPALLQTGDEMPIGGQTVRM